MKLENKRIVITGGTSGIGLELVRNLCVNNDILVISKDRSLPQEILNTSKAVATYHADLANQSQLEEVADKINREYEHIDVLINNAAIQYTPYFLDDEFNFDGIQREIDVNFSAVCKLTYLMLPLLERTSQALILNVNSGLALAPKTSSAVYCATKAALHSFSLSLGYQLSNSNIAVKQMFLPLVETNMTKGRPGHKYSADWVAKRILRTAESQRSAHYIGKAKILRWVMRIAPSLGHKIMRSS